MSGLLPFGSVQECPKCGAARPRYSSFISWRPNTLVDVRCVASIEYEPAREARPEKNSTDHCDYWLEAIGFWGSKYRCTCSSSFLCPETVESRSSRDCKGVYKCHVPARPAVPGHLVIRCTCGYCWQEKTQDAG